MLCTAKEFNMELNLAMTLYKPLETKTGGGRMYLREIRLLLHWAFNQD